MLPRGDPGSSICRAGGRSRPRSPSRGHLPTGGESRAPDPIPKKKKNTHLLLMRLQNSLFVSWPSPTGMDCKLVGPETPRLPLQDLPLRPSEGMRPIRCRCKHFCSGFHSCFACACGQPAYAHDTVVEPKHERLAQGKPVGQDVPYDSGLGAPSIGLLDSPVTAMDHPFLTAFQASSRSSPGTLSDVGTSSQLSSIKRPVEDDTAFFERRYQERIKVEKVAKQKGKAPLPSSTKPS
ncbi:unnamed protein product [Nyctereutes procyonoides]|uniref:Protein FAM221A n=1 Tax=Nyctereutes procyonoides TaxID=34880 RepID=A0A811YH63_NYCPR|nr:unnamed protein product [Nyctereutes procyonoides]